MLEIEKEVLNAIPAQLANILPNGVMPYALLLSGSRFLQVPTNISDFDILVIVSNDDYLTHSSFNDLDNHVMINSYYVHFYLRPINLLLNKHLYSNISCLLGRICESLFPITREDLIILNDNKQLDDFIKAWNTKKYLKKLKTLYCESSDYYLMPQIIAQHDYSFKRLYYYLCIYSKLNNIPLKTTQIIKVKIGYKSADLTLANNIAELTSEEQLFIDKALKFSLNWLQDIV